MTTAMSIGAVVAASFLGFVIAAAVQYLVTKNRKAELLKRAQLDAQNILKDAESEAKNIKKEKELEAKEEWHKRKMEFDTESNKKNQKLKSLEKSISDREDGIKKNLDLIQKKEQKLMGFDADLKKKESKIDERNKEVDNLINEQKAELEKVAGLSREDAKARLVEQMTNEAKNDAAAIAHKIREEARHSAKKDAQNVVVQAIQRSASDHSTETTVAVVNLDSDEMKGRIIGREGRNIRAFEAATGIDLIIDDTPEAVVISGFDPFRREVAKIALERLMIDGRIHPTRIEEVVEKVSKELENNLAEIGEQTILELGIHNMHNELLKLIGRMKYRTSYGQNLLNHAIEVATLAGIMAAEIGIDIVTAKRAALLHDIGKVVEGETAPHALIGYELAKKYKEKSIVSNAIGAHHEDIEMESPIAVLVQAADSISGARPGARRESLENYVKRLQKLEEIAQSFEGVSKTFAIQAGREIRVIVEPVAVDDFAADEIAVNIGKKIEQEMEYPGQIKVTVVRERRSVAFAK
jgi:ribonuclease Y